MADILHRVEIKASPAEVYRSLATIEGLAGWWTTETRGRSAVGDAIEFRFGKPSGLDMKVLELEPEKRVAWQVIAGPKDWLGTKIGFELARNGEFTAVSFKHAGWEEGAEFMPHCSTKWAMFMMSLKALGETGQGAPFPNDVHIAGPAS
jgi:uncharacterized protein YndB with AHSA1/START domain